MKRNLLLSLMFFLLLETFGQDKSARYSVSGGLLGALNFTDLHLTGTDNSNINFKKKTRISGGVWLDFPLGKTLSFEPQLMYSSYKYESNITDGTVFKGKMEYVSVPILLKVHAGSYLAIAAGPQVDFLSSVKDDYHNYSKNDFKKTNISINAGIEIFPHAIVTIFGRYIHGLSNLDTENANNKFYNRNIQAGLKCKLFGKTIKPLAPVPIVAAAIPPADSDSDGVSDAEDKCPSQAGLAKYEGCPIPDTDEDGINNEEDKCPTQKGLAKYAGCPVPDSDADGINDEEDKCADKAGVARYGGCPVPDSDMDGINDEEDGCPKAAGPGANNGCPVIDIDAYKVVFKSGSSVLLPAGKTELNKAVSYLKSNKGFDVMIEGHTDNSGSEKLNLAMSKKRAVAVKAYFIKNGISAKRLFTKGYGSSLPVADNTTLEGRKHNRRIEVKMKQ